MSMVYFISDLHLGHKSMAVKRGFNDEFEMHEHIVKQWNSVVNKKDKVFVLGDMSMENKKHYYVLDQLNGIKEVVMGNHDRHQDVQELLKYVNGVSGMIKYERKGYPKVFLTHCPIHPVELGYRVEHNIHGHVHENTIQIWKEGNILFKGKYINDPRYINVSCEAVDYTPKRIDQLIEQKYNYES